MRPAAVIEMDAPNTEEVESGGVSLAWELAAVASAIQDLETERTEANRGFTARKKQLQKRERELIDEIKRGGAQLRINFGSMVAETKAAAEAAAEAELEAEDADVEEEVIEGDDEEIER